MMRKQRGVTMIELLIAMTLSLGLVAGIGQLFVQSQKSFRLQRNLSDMMDDATFALEDLAKGILSANYSEDGSVVPNYIGSDSTDNTLSYSFKLGDLSQRNNSICLAGSSTTIGATIKVDIFTENTNDLSCESGTATQPLIQNVEKLEFRYGIKTSAGLFYYTKAANVTDWKKVFAVKVFLVMRSAEVNLVKSEMKYKIEDTEYPNPAATDRRLYKVFTKTIFLRSTDK